MREQVDAEPANEGLLRDSVTAFWAGCEGLPVQPHHVVWGRGGVGWGRDAPCSGTWRRGDPKGAGEQAGSAEEEGEVAERGEPITERLGKAAGRAVAWGEGSTGAAVG